MLDLDPSRVPAPPRDAATVIVLRPTPAGGAEVLCVVRHVRSGFLGGAVVFPGGKVDEADADPRWDTLATAPHARAQLFAGADGRFSARALAVAACRETLEEAGIVPVDRSFVADDAEDLRKEAASTDFVSAAAKRKLHLAIDRLVPFGRWVTPTAESRRFDARFFLLELPPGQIARHDERETTQSFWATPDAVLARSARGDIFLAPPTIRTLELLRGCDIPAAMAIAARQSLEPVCPIFVPDAEGGFLALPGDPEHEVRERRLDGPTRFVMRDGRFSSTDPPL